MVVELAALGKAIVGKVFTFAASGVKGWLAKKRAGERAMRGGSLPSEGALEHIVKSELRNLSTSSALPQELQNDGFRAWLLTDDCIACFCTVLIAQAGGDPALAQRACDELASRYEQATGETRKLAMGPLNLAVSYVYRQLRATVSSKDAFDNAIALRNSAQIHALGHPELRPFPRGADLERLQRLSEQLLAAGRTSWKMPKFVAPLTLEAHEEKDDKATHPITTEQLAEIIESGDSIVMFGDGGIGKTTYLLELSSLFLRASRVRKPLYVDAAIWARSRVSILDYIAGTPSAQALNVTPGELARLAESGFLIVMVNGWNEIPASLKAYCRETFNLLTTAAPALAVVVASRSAHDVPNLVSARRIAVLGLTWRGQSAVVRSELGEVAALSLLEVLARDTRLRQAARSPLILRGLIAKSRIGVEASSNVYELLGAVLTTFEHDEKRNLILAESPVFGMQEHYLEELACSLNARGATNLTREDALVALTVAATRMVKHGLLGAVPQPLTVLEVLASHHLLHIQDTFVRFAHQRFQEYYAAAHLLRIGGPDNILMPLLRDAVNQPAWAESLELVAARLKAPGGSATTRAQLVQAAEAVDLTYACDLAGLCAFNDADEFQLYRRIVLRVNAMRASSVLEVQELATTCQIASRFPAFADQLWVLLESDDVQARHNLHMLGRSAVTLAQFGPLAEARIKAWPPERRAELMQDIGDNPDNYDFIASSATEDPDPAVREAAMSALFWNFPTSTVATRVWLDAPFEVQVKHEFVNFIDYALEQGVVDEKVRAQLLVIATGDISDQSRLKLALVFPNEMGPHVTNFVLDQMKNEGRHRVPEALISIARAYSPDRLSALAVELVAGPRGAPEWVETVLHGETPEVREAAFEQAWGALQVGIVERLNPKIVGPLSNRSQTERSVSVWLRNCLEGRHLPDTEQRRGIEIGYLLAHAPGDDLLGVVMGLGAGASYKQAVELADLLLTRVSRDEGRVSRDNHWSPTSQQFNSLFSLLSNKSEPVRNSHDRLFVLLVCIASHCEPSEFGPLLLEALRRQLDAWSTYRALKKEWETSPDTPRPKKPSQGLFLISAIARWGIDALPGVLELMSHPNSSDLVPDVIGRIAGLPWSSKDRQTYGSVNTDIEEGNERRAAGRLLQQPTATYQAATDEAARILARLLNDEVNFQLTERETNPKWREKQAEYRVSHLVGILANLPSSEIIVAVTYALSSGLVGVNGYVGALRGLTRQGWILSDARVVQQFEELYERETRPSRIHESTMYTVAEFSQLMFLVEPVTLLKLPLSHYLNQWQRFAHPLRIIQVLAGMKSRQSFASLLVLEKDWSAKGESTEGFAIPLSSTLSPENFVEFASLVADGTLFSWGGDVLTMKHIAPAVTSVVKDVPEHLSLLIGSCRRNASPLADALLCEVLSQVDCQTAARLEVGLEAMDAGRANDTSQPAYRMLKNMFTRTVSRALNQDEVYSKACNPLRLELYRRAKTGGAAATAARCLLASVEFQRRERGHPADEPRHPDVIDGVPWTDIFLPDDASL